MISRTTGILGEKIARNFLERKGYVFCSVNEHTRWGEIDLIMENPQGITTFVEVKMKRSRIFGLPEDQFHSSKQQRLRRAIEWYCLRHGITRYYVDLIAIEGVNGVLEIRHYQNVEMGGYDYQ